MRCIDIKSLFLILLWTDLIIKMRRGVSPNKNIKIINKIDKCKYLVNRNEGEKELVFL
jgi:hypothetical protein